jgi:K+-transporting ATPase A subunit
VTLSYGSIGLLTRPLGRYLARVYGGQYAGETTMSNLSQMAGITVHSFLSTASG